MSNMLASRKVPLVLAAGIGSGLLYMTYGANQQPRPRQQQGEGGGVGVSETLQAAAGQGGARARQYDPKDTRLHSADPAAQSKRNPDKTRGDDLGGDGTSPGAGLGKHTGDRGEGQAGDLARKRTGS